MKVASILSLAILLSTCVGALSAAVDNSIKRACWNKVVSAMECDLKDGFSQQGIACQNQARIMYQNCLTRHRNSQASEGLAVPRKVGKQPGS